MLVLVSELELVVVAVVVVHVLQLLTYTKIVLYYDAFCEPGESSITPRAPCPSRTHLYHRPPPASPTALLLAKVA